MYIFRSTLIFKKVKFILFALLVSLTESGCASNMHDSFAAYNGYMITLPKKSTVEDVKWAKYLYDHLLKRSMKSGVVTYATDKKDFYHLQVCVDPYLEKDFQVICNKGKISLISRNDRDLLWLIYQLMKSIGNEDKRIDAADLPPAVLAMKDTIGNVSFKYREAYYPENLDPDMSGILGMNNVNYDWGLWGHHLSDAIGKNPDSSVFSVVKGEKYYDQYCFSSEVTYKKIENYIIDNYGDGKKKSQRFVISPNDDDCVCMCPLCKAAGNTPTNATPAVANLVIRLAKRFPAHQFFMLSYLSTVLPSLRSFPTNAGVIISTMNFPLKSRMNGDKKFEKLVDGWRKTTPHIYIWDYINNFDDYFTPFPVLKREQKRLQYFRNLSIEGVFLNGSGEDYSSFSDLNTFVFSALLINPYWSVDDLVHKYFFQYYPKSAKMLEKYYISIEDNAMRSDKKISWYGGIQDAVDVYLQPSLFFSFYNELSSVLNIVRDEEKQKLDQLFVALTYTRLELARIFSDREDGCLVRHGGVTSAKPEMFTLIDRLGKYRSFKNMSKYQEGLGELDKYIADWQKYILPEKMNNLLKGKDIHPLTKLDEGYENLKILTDGVHGLPSNYHSGWLISSIGQTFEVSIPVKSVHNEAKIFRISFLHSPHFHLFCPKRVELVKNGKIYKIYNPVADSNVPYQLIEVKGEINLSDATALNVRIIRADGKRKNIACDEIQLNP